jgi:hypothetical protein
MHVPKNVAMLSRRILWGFALSLALASPVLAGEFKLGPKAVLELFTSQGCSSCPKADAMFEQVGKRPDVVTLAYHVDYWDYIGWQDTFGTPENSDRQRDYAEAWGSSRIFTPQMVVNGKGGVVGSKTDAVNGALASATLPLTVSLTEQQGGLIDISVPAMPTSPAARSGSSPSSTMPRSPSSAARTRANRSPIPRSSPAGRSWACGIRRPAPS